MNSWKLIGLAVAGLIICSCQSDVYSINGYAKTLRDGDTIWFAEVANPGNIISGAIVSEGHAGDIAQRISVESIRNDIEQPVASAE